MTSTWDSSQNLDPSKMASDLCLPIMISRWGSMKRRKTREQSYGFDPGLKPKNLYMVWFLIRKQIGTEYD